MKRSISNLQTMLCLGLMFVFVMLCSSDKAYGASPITINTVDYQEENIIVNNNGNSKIYFATENDAARNSWEVINADAGSTTSIDFSWLSPTSRQVIVIKGENSVQRRVTIKERARKLEVSITYDKLSSLSKTDTIAKLLNIMSSAGTGEKPIDFYDLGMEKR